MIAPETSQREQTSVVQTAQTSGAQRTPGWTNLSSRLQMASAARQIVGQAASWQRGAVPRAARQTVVLMQKSAEQRGAQTTMLRRHEALHGHLRETRERRGSPRPLL